jgi:hypothetical protein
MASPGKVVVDSMVAVAADCLLHPGRAAVWSPQLRKYVCPKTSGIPEADLDRRSIARPPISAEFKLVFLSALGATALCLLLTTDIVKGLFGLANAGIGALFGLLGGQRLHASESR